MTNLTELDVGTNYTYPLIETLKELSNLKKYGLVKVIQLKIKFKKNFQI